MFVVIDRFEDIYAVCECEDESMINIEKEKIPKEAKEGDVLLVNNDNIVIDYAETEKRKKEIEELMKDMWNK